jgi:hypothetical protein
MFRGRVRVAVRLWLPLGLRLGYVWLRKGLGFCMMSVVGVMVRVRVKARLGLGFLLFLG